MISVIIPTYNEEAHIKATIQKLLRQDEKNLIKEIIISDGGSTDSTIEASRQSETIVIKCEQKGRAAQMNKGAAIANGQILYFLHADSSPPEKFTEHILEAHRKGAVSGCFRLAFDYNHWFLKANAWFTKFDVNAVRFGDQSLFVTKEVFEKAGGFKESLLMMEDQEIIHRIKKHGKFKVMNDHVITSARKYLDNGIYRMQAIFFRMWFLYYLGFSQERLLNIYRRLINNHKL